MKLAYLGERLRQYWREQALAYSQDFRRLDSVSRLTAFGMVALGAVLGLVPLGGMIVLFRLVDAVTGARAIRVLTSDLHRGLATLLVVWVVAVASFAFARLLQGLARRIVDRTAVIIFMTSIIVALLLVTPFRALLVVATHAVLHPWITDRRVCIACVAMHGVLSVWMLSTITSFLLSRSLTVGSYILFLGAIFGALTITVLHAVACRTV